MNIELPVIQLPPGYCEYAAGPCDQLFAGTPVAAGTFLYASTPQNIASTIESGVVALRTRTPGKVWTTWREHRSTGQTVFCSICRSMRFANLIVADVTTLNFNVLFEIGFAFGLGIPVIPIRDSNVEVDEDDFRTLGLLDTVGYLDFRNSEELAARLTEKLPGAPIAAVSSKVATEAHLYVVKGHVPTEGDVRMMSTLSRTGMYVRTLDVVETPRVSLHEVRRQVTSAVGVLVHLMATYRKGANVHNARCAFVAGMALASGKVVLMLEEDVNHQPIDYRDIVQSYRRVEDVPSLVEPFLRDVIGRLSDGHLRDEHAPEQFLEKLDLGDSAAENESQSLQYYFVRTAQFNEAKRGFARLVVGRKGAGKTALFYGVRDSIAKGHGHLKLDLKPEGHQFTKLREVILSRLTLGLQEHTLTAFWNYIILCEIAERVREQDYSWAQRDDSRWAKFEHLMRVYGAQVPADVGDFSERLSRQVERMMKRFAAIDPTAVVTGGELTRALFNSEIRDLDDALAPYLGEKDDVWVLVDNLDKGWPTRGTRSTDIMILRTLLEATRKIQKQLEQREVRFHSMVFLRNDIYEHLIEETPDRGKETSVALEWDDEELFKELIRRRVQASTDLKGEFGTLWAAIAEPFVDTQESFRYLLSRTLMRPRDLLNFLQRAIGVAINRGHTRVTGADILKAEEAYSEDMLLNTAFELRDVYPEMVDVLYVFRGASETIPVASVNALIGEVGVRDESREELVELLVWFGFLGVVESGKGSAVYAYQARYNVEKVMAPIRLGRASFCIHPAFRSALAM